MEADLSYKDSLKVSFADLDCTKQIAYSIPLSVILLTTDDDIICSKLGSETTRYTRCPTCSTEPFMTCTLLSIREHTEENCTRIVNLTIKQSKTNSMQELGQCTDPAESYSALMDDGTSVHLALSLYRLLEHKTRKLKPIDSFVTIKMHVKRVRTFHLFVGLSLPGRYPFIGTI